MGEPSYGRNNKNAGGLKLTAYGLEFDCPFTGRPLKFERPVGGSAMEFDQSCSGEPFRHTSVMARAGSNPKGISIMFKVSVMYPNQQDARFDVEYYRTKHMELVQKHLKPFGLVRTEVLKGISGTAGQPAPYICIGNLYFTAADGYEKGIAASAGALRADIPNFTNVTPVRQVSEILTPA
jgi:uncharacterized protein (TIGR02118 family)